MHRTYLLCLALLASGAARAHAQNAADSAGIRATAHDYIDGWYEGDAARMERALHTHLAKRLVYQDDQGRSRLVDLTALELVQSTRRGVGKIPPAERRDSVTILDIFGNAAGSGPSAARSAVMTPGRRRSMAPRRTASSSAAPASRTRLNSPTSSTPFCTESPNRAMNPTAADTLRLRCRPHNAAMPPIRANGRLTRIKLAYLVEPNAENSRMKINAMLVGTITARRAMARRWFSNCPPHTTR